MPRATQRSKQKKDTKSIPDQYKKEHKEDKKIDFKIYPPRKEQDFIKIERELHPFYKSMFSKNGGVLFVAAPPGSGKSAYISNLLGRDEYFKDLFEGGVFICSPTIHNDLGAGVLRAVADNIEDDFTEEYARNMFKVLSGDDDEEDDGNGLSCLLFDDCMGQFKNNTFVGRICSMCRHLKSLIIFSNQRVVGVPSNIRANISHSVIFNQPSSKEYERLVEMHNCFGGEDNFNKMYEEACGVRYGTLMCDFREMKAYRQDPQSGEIIEIYSRYNEDGTFKNNKDTISTDIKNDIPDKKNDI